jgi:hypothetical protein
MPNDDQFGDAVPLKQDPFGQPQELAAKKKPGLLQRAEKWWTTPTEDLLPLGKGGTHAPGEPAPQPTFSTPQEKTRSSLGSASAMALLPALAAAPAATLLGLGGSAIGGTAGSIGGKYLGEKVGAPELGGDVGGFAGSILGGYGGSRVPGLAKNALIDATGRPKPLARLTIGSDRASALGELLDPESAAYERSAQDLMRRGKAQDVLDRQAARQAKANAPDPLQGRPSLFPGATSSVNPPRGAELPKPTTMPGAGASTTTATPHVGRNDIVSSAFKTEETTAPSKIIRPGTPGANPEPIQGSYWSFDKQALTNAVMLGDRDAAVVYRNRFGELPPNARYLTDVAEAPMKGLYRGKQ